MRLAKAFSKDLVSNLWSHLPVDLAHSTIDSSLEDLTEPLRDEVARDLYIARGYYMISPYYGLIDCDRETLGQSSRIREDYLPTNLGLVFYEVDDDVAITNIFEGVVDFFQYLPCWSVPR